MAVNIGAKIGIEGEAAYRKSISNIINSTKNLKAEFKEIESSIGNNKTIEKVAKQRENLNKQLQETTKVLEKQKEVLDKAQQHNLNQSIGLDWANVDKNLIPEGKLEQYQRNILNTQTEINNLKNRIEELPSSIKLVSEAFRNGTSEWGEVLKGVGSFMSKYVTVPLTAGATVSVKSFADWESAFTGVKKTVEGTPEELEAVAKGITEIALSTASSREDVAAVAEAAGQLGIATDEVVDFTRVMVMLGDTTNLAADEAATALARVFNITGEKNYEAIGNAVVHLGNNFATTESEIVHMTNRLAAGGTLAGLTTQEILGLATAMSSVGITAEAGGTAMTQTLTAIEKQFAAFSTGAESDLPRIAEIAGMSAEQFAEAWKDRPAEAIQAFISGLGSLDEKGESATLVLDELGMAGIRQSNMLKSLGLASEVLAKSMEKANQAYIGVNENGEEFAALSEEASKRYQDFAVKVNQLKVSFKLLGSEVGSTIVGMIIPVIERLKTSLVAMAGWWEQQPDSIKKFIVALGGIVAAVGPALLVIGNLLIFVAKMKDALTVLGGTAKIMENIGKVFSSGIFKTIGGIGLVLSGAVTAIKNFFDMWRNGWSATSEIFKDIGIAMAALGAVLLGAPAMVAGIVAAVVAIGTSLVVWVKENWDSIVTFTQNLFTALKDAWDTFSGLVRELIRFFIEWIVTKIQEMRDKATTFFTNLKDNALNIFENMRNGVSQRVNAVKEAIVSGLTNAINWIKQLPSQAVNWGADIMRSMAQGIRNAISLVTNAVSNVASRVRSFLHFSEPDVGPLSDFSTYMPDMMRLMAKGINDNAYLVEDALTNVTGMMAGNMESEGAPNYNYGGVVINMNVPEGANGRMLVEEIESELAARTVRRKAVFG